MFVYMCVCFIILFYFNCLRFLSALARFFILGEELYRQTGDLGGNHRLSAGQAWNHSWVITMAVGSSMKTLQGSFPGISSGRISPSTESWICTVFEGIFLSQIKAYVEQEKLNGRRITTICTLVSR